MAVLTCNNLTKYFDHALALDHVNLEIQPGRIVGLLGPNGSGKTTLIKLANGLLTPSSGELRIDGQLPSPATRELVSYLPERPYLADWMTVSQLLDFFCDFYANFDRGAAEKMLMALQISPKLRIKQMSKGTREKVQLILVMSRRARLYLLDEPIGGVDPATRDYIIRTILTNFDENASIVISTHLIADVENILDDVIFIRNGGIMLQSSVDEIRQERGCSVDELFREVFRYVGKLIKHEFRATGRILLPVYLVMLLTAALVRGFQVLTEQTAGEFMRALAVLSVLLFSAAVFGGSILAFVLMIYRFYKNLMTDEGYLMFTLPVTTGQLIWSKMIVSAVWLLATAAMDVLSMFISVFDSAAWRDIFQLPGLLWQQLREYAGNLGLIPAEIVVLVLLAALVCFLKFYAAIALGHSFTNRKMLLSVAFFAAFSVAEQIAVSAGLIGFASVGIPRSWLRGAVGTMDYYAQLVLGGAILAVVLYGAVYYAVTYLSLKKRLNLQ